MIERLLRRWLNPAFYVCEWSLYLGGFTPQINGKSSNLDVDAFEKQIKSAYPKSRLSYSVRPASIRERLRYHS